MSFVDSFYNELLVLVVTFTLLCPHNLELALHKHYILKVTYVLFENFFPIFYRYLCEMFGVVLSVTFIIPVIYPLFIAVMVVSYLCVYLSC